MPEIFAACSIAGRKRHKKSPALLVGFLNSELLREHVFLNEKRELRTGLKTGLSGTVKIRCDRLYSELSTFYHVSRFCNVIPRSSNVPLLRVHLPY